MPPLQHHLVKDATWADYLLNLVNLLAGTGGHQLNEKTVASNLLVKTSLNLISGATLACPSL